jgi:hypothetical protein
MKTYSLNYRKTGMVLVATMFIALLFTSCKKGALDKASPTLGKISSTTASYPGSVATTISNGLIAYWPLSNITNDLSGNGYNGTASNVSATTDRAGNASGAYAFNGTTSSISVANQTALSLHGTDFSINAWVNLSSSSGGNILSKRIQGDTTGWTLSIGNNQIAFGPGGGATHAFAYPTINTSQWYMVTTVYTSATHTMKIYVNGTLSSTSTGVPSPAVLSAALYIGRDDPGAGTGYFFPGSIGDVRMYNRAVSDTEISELYSATCAPTGSVIAYWPLTNTVSDLSGNGNNGTATSLTSGTDRLGNSLGAYTFNGTTSYISVVNQTALSLHGTDFTINAWVDLSSSGGGNIISKRIQGDTTGYTLSIGNNQIAFGPGGGATHAFAYPTVSTSQWYMVTTVYTSATHTMYIYVNGTLSSTSTGVPSPAVLSAALYIGRDDPGAGTGYFFPGSMSNIRMYSRAVTATEVSALYNALD